MPSSLHIARAFLALGSLLLVLGALFFVHLVLRSPWAHGLEPLVFIFILAGGITSVLGFGRLAAHRKGALPPRPSLLVALSEISVLVFLGFLVLEGVLFSMEAWFGRDFIPPWLFFTAIIGILATLALAFALQLLRNLFGK